MSEVKFGPKTLPRLLHGTSPFMGAGQFGSKAQEWYQRFFHHPERMADLFSFFCEQKFPGVHVVGYPTLIEAARITKETYPLKVAVSLLPENWNENLELVATLEPEVVFVHGVMTDNYLQKHTTALLSCFQAIRDHSAFPGLATHDTRQTLLSIQTSSNSLFQEPFGLLLPINSMGWGMGGSLNDILKMLQKIDDRPVMAMKTLAAGQLPPNEALKFVFGISQVQVATIGMTSKEEVTEIASVGHNLFKSEAKDQ
ncbi:MAG: hypothetical protein ACFFDT_12430 [Candidatus Hodarchaeota archaeon]